MHKKLLALIKYKLILMSNININKKFISLKICYILVFKIKT